MTLLFSKISLADKAEIETILSQVSTLSCQLSFASLFCWKEKYGTEICIQNKTLFIRQLSRIYNKKIAYFLPIGGDCLKTDIENIMNTAKMQLHEVFFFCLFKEDQDRLLQMNEYSFIFETTPDWSEYLYYSNRIANLTDHNLSKIRRGVNQFWQLYGQNISIEKITKKNILSIMNFQEEWYSRNLERNQEPLSLTAENKAIHTGLLNFEALGLDGMIIKFNENIIGYSYGLIVSGNVFDIMVQKAKYEYRHIYKVLFQEIANRQLKESTFINMEEDIGILGLRRLKQEYKPDFMLVKYTAIPKRNDE